MKRLAGALLTTFVLLTLAPAAHAGSLSDKINRHRAEIEAKIACRIAESKGKPCAPAKPAAGAKPAAKPAGSGRVIEIVIAEQTLRAWDGGRLVLQTPVSTGASGTGTPRGRYSVLSKEGRHWSTRFGVWMPYAMRVVGGIFIHELPLTSDGRRIGAGSLGRPVSHGCIRVGVGPAAQLFNWASIGTPVVIR